MGLVLPGDRDLTSPERRPLPPEELDVSKLRDRDRELVSLHYAGLNGGQIAELLDAERNTIDVALHRALARMPNDQCPIDRKPRAFRSLAWLSFGMPSTYLRRKRSERISEALLQK